MFTSFWESMPIAARLHPPHPPPSVFAQTLRKVEATDCRRSRRRIKPCVDLRHSLFPFRSRILQGHILGESLSCVTCYQEFPNVQQDPLYRSLELTDSPFTGAEARDHLRFRLVLEFQAAQTDGLFEDLRIGSQGRKEWKE